MEGRAAQARERGCVLRPFRLWETLSKHNTSHVRAGVNHGIEQDGLVAILTVQRL
jgi:hypothetical protein